jgi:N,N'-diacetyllegionaminate synthase
VSATIEIGRRRIGRGHPCFVIAEVGVNHNGDLRLAHELIDLAAGAGADAVKFQTFTPDLLAAEDAPQAEYQKVHAPAESQLEMLTRLALDEPAHAELKSHADAVGITFLSSPFDEPAVALLERVGVPAYKIPSGEVTNHRLLRRVAETGAPILMSTGMCTLDEVEEAVAVLGPAEDRLALLHCVSSYPADPRDCNLRAIELMRSRFNRPVGWSDHTEGIAIASAAVAVGADIVEKHVTLDRTLPGPDHAASVEPSELRAMIAAIRTVEAALGAPRKGPSEAERAIAAVVRKSLHWQRRLAPGEPVGLDDMIALRPGTGIPPSRMSQLIGRPVQVATKVGSPVRLEEFASLDDPD